MSEWKLYRMSKKILLHEFLSRTQKDLLLLLKSLWFYVHMFISKILLISIRKKNSKSYQLFHRLYVTNRQIFLFIILLWMYRNTYLKTPQYAWEFSNPWSEGITLSRNLGVSDKDAIAARSHWSPSSPASTWNLCVSLVLSLMNLGLWQISWKLKELSHVIPE